MRWIVSCRLESIASLIWVGNLPTRFLATWHLQVSRVPFVVSQSRDSVQSFLTFLPFAIGTHEELMYRNRSDVPHR